MDKASDLIYKYCFLAAKIIFILSVAAFFVAVIIKCIFRVMDDEMGGLASALDSIATGESQRSLLKALYASHPETHDRIGRLQAMGVPYSRY